MIDSLLIALFVHSEVDIAPVVNQPRVRIDVEVHKPRRSTPPVAGRDSGPSSPPAYRTDYGNASHCKIHEDDSITCIPPVVRSRAADLPSAILRAAREIQLPALALVVQPANRTLVNFDTNLYTKPVDFNRTITLLGHTVDLRATPETYTWHTGDGTTRTTQKPGRPHPHLDITHNYQKPAQQLHARVDVTYRIDYRINGGDWQRLSEDITATGPPTQLRVDQARPIITGGR